MFISSLPIALRMFFVLHVVVKGTKTISLKVLHLGQEEYAIQMKIINSDKYQNQLVARDFRQHFFSQEIASFY